MYKFNSDTEKLEFLKKYKLAPPTSTELPTLYYYAPTLDIPCICEVIGYDAIHESWSVITINANNRIVNIHSDHLLEMKRRGNAFFKKECISQSNSTDTYVVFDLETTGKNNKKDEIIEISAIKCTPQGIIEFNELVNVQSIIPLDISLLTGITNDMLSSAETIEIILPKFLSFIKNHTLIGHNIKSFDLHFINKVCRDLGLPEIKNELVDTLYLSRERLPQLTNHKLSTICEYYKIDFSNAHRALADCYMCNECYIRLLHENSQPSNKSFKTPSCAALSDEKLKSMILPMLDDIISELELPKDGLILRDNKGQKKKTTSIFISEPPFPSVQQSSSKINATQSILNYEIKDNVIILIVSNVIFDIIPCPNNVYHKETKQFVKLFFPADHSELLDYIKKIIYYKVKIYSSAASLFGCCDRFIECSDAQKCVHENKLYSTACMYRTNLESGKIFYGKNRNV